MKKIHLGKTATSRTRRKPIPENEYEKVKLPDDSYTRYLMQKGYSSKSILTYTSNIKRFKTWIEKEDIEMENVTYNDITSFLQAYRNQAQKSKVNYICSLRQYFNHLIKDQHRTDNPADFITIKGLKRKTLYDILSRNELVALYDQFTSTTFIDEKHKNQNWYVSSMLASKRNNAILGLMIFQGLDGRDLVLLKVNDVKMREGTVFIPGTRKSDARDLPLESFQVIDLMEYILKARNEMLQSADKQSDQLFISQGNGKNFANLMSQVLKKLYSINPRIISPKQIRASVIVHWLKVHNLRQAQYLAGHRYVSSTEGFLMNDMDDMIEEIEKYHPTI